MKQYIFSAVCLMSGVLCMSSCNEDKQAKPYTPDYEIVPEYTNADTWTAYEAFNDNLLDPDKNIIKQVPLILLLPTVITELLLSGANRSIGIWL